MTPVVEISKDGTIVAVINVRGIAYYVRRNQTDDPAGITTRLAAVHFPSEKYWPHQQEQGSLLLDHMDWHKNSTTNGTELRKLHNLLRNIGVDPETLKPLVTTAPSVSMCAEHELQLAAAIALGTSGATGTQRAKLKPPDKPTKTQRRSWKRSDQ